ncbi:oxidative stress-induced growth inhibitor 1-like [Coccinella septempunctata]|uniref:oxidative stress-induced growth inhibitor 1-like n=1 Tax=Coccinella septempunctata TaxID=41139 RepID=UPI001D09220C|nr:oxidative stress-induced growth inhibitor 1-like [Coccinella septempunctata]XP_044744999.1 oxidative stress-induced growth inhibitor 1-like [Coccinella septempunctata]XP_044745000.1 oxidative stress-induced growth inhibitor 1-like [Coccinella septempunctata]
MKSEFQQETIHKEVVVIGNGPSGIALSYMLSGNLPYITSTSHPDEMLATRLTAAADRSLIEADLEFLASGLEGRSSNPISLLLDALLHPYADAGIEMEPLVEFRKSGREIDHVVLGKGLPGGSWHKMDPQILTLSLGSWMSLPGLPFNSRDSGERRAYASSVAQYYVKYVDEMKLTKYFRNNVIVSAVRPVETSRKNDIVKEDMNWVKKIDENDRMSLCAAIGTKNKPRKCIISNAINYIWNRSGKRDSKKCKRARSQRTHNEQSPNGIRGLLSEDKYSYIQSDTESFDSNTSLSSTDSGVLDPRRDGVQIPQSRERTEDEVNWTVETQDLESGKTTIYTCKYLILANGCHDVPNKLSLTKGQDPDWLLYDLRTLEWCLDTNMIAQNSPRLDPVLVVGAGLSAADAVIALRGRNIPVLHAFRNKSADLNRQLPENMYPEYHKVHQMMQDGGSTYPLYTSFPEYSLTGINREEHTVILCPKDGVPVEIKVSYAIVLIGSRPDLTFLPRSSEIAIKQHVPIDGKTNAVNMNKLTHRVKGYKNLYAVGTLAGDNFVRFIPGGALAVVTDLYKRSEVNET